MISVKIKDKLIQLGTCLLLNVIAKGEAMILRSNVEQDANLMIWLEAMRSGDYEQGKGSYVEKYQNAPDKHDPVGVARDVFKDVIGEEELANKVGLPLQLIKETIEISDSGHTWDEICTFIEENL